ARRLTYGHLEEAHATFIRAAADINVVGHPSDDTVLDQTIGALCHRAKLAWIEVLRHLQEGQIDDQERTLGSAELLVMDQAWVGTIALLDDVTSGRGSGGLEGDAQILRFVRYTG